MLGRAHPAFRGHSLGHFGGDFGPEGPEDSCRGSRLSQPKPPPKILKCPKSPRYTNFYEKLPRTSAWSHVTRVRNPADMSGLPFCRAFVVMNFHSESVDFVMDFCVNFLCGFLGAFRPFKRRTENPQRNPQQNSRQNPCKIHACSEKRRRKIHSAGRGARDMVQKNFLR